VLLSIAIGTLVAWPMHLLDFSSVHSAEWVGFSGFFRFGHPKFEAAAIISMCIVMLGTWRRKGSESAVTVAVREGAVAVNVPDDGGRDDQI
jgi:xanthine/uracil permease